MNIAGINQGMAKLLGNPRILGQGGRAYGCPSWDNPGMAKLLGNPGVLQQGVIWLSILGKSRDVQVTRESRVT